MSAIACAISKLPIKPGEGMVCIPLRARNSYFGDQMKMEIETGSTFTYSTDILYPFGFPIKGKAGRNVVFESIVKDAGVKGLERFFNLPINELVHILSRTSEEVDLDIHRDLRVSTCIFVKRKIYDYLAQSPIPSMFNTDLGKEYDELQDMLKAWNEKKSQNSDMTPDEEMFDEMNPFNLLGSSRVRLFSTVSQRQYLFRQIYKQELIDNTIREHLLELHAFIENVEDIGQYFIPSFMSGHEYDANAHRELHEECRSELQHQLLKLEEEDDYFS